jgi:hypothetical protein
MIGTSVVIPPAALAWRLAGEVRARRECPAPIALRDAVPVVDRESARVRPVREPAAVTRRDEVVVTPRAAPDRFAGHHA